YTASARALGQAPPRPRAWARAFGGVMLGVGVVLLAVLGVAYLEYQRSGDFLGFLLPDAVRGQVEAWLDVPPPAAGESTTWTLRGGSPLGASWLYSFAAVCVVGLGLMAVVITALFEARSGAPIISLAAAGTLVLLTV